MEKEEQQKEEKWSRARVVFGRLIEVDKKRQCIVVEYKERGEWSSEEFTTKGCTDADYDELRALIDSDVTIDVEDHQITSYGPSSSPVGRRRIGWS
jgi:hypothetical protein